MREIDDLSAAAAALEDARRRAEAATAAGDRAGWMAASETVWAAEADLAGAKERIGLVFALLLRCALDAPTATVSSLALALAPAAEMAAGDRLGWLTRQVNRLTAENRELADAVLALQQEAQSLRGGVRNGDFGRRPEASRGDRATA